MKKLKTLMILMLVLCSTLVFADSVSARIKVGETKHVEGSRIGEALTRTFIEVFEQEKIEYKVIKREFPYTSNTLRNTICWCKHDLMLQSEFDAYAKTKETFTYSDFKEGYCVNKIGGFDNYKDCIKSGDSRTVIWVEADSIPKVNFARKVTNTFLNLFKSFNPYF